MSSKKNLSILQMFYSLNLRLFFTLVLVSLIPLVYKTIRIHFLGDYPSDWGVNIASQVAWLNVLYEVIQEALILPVFYVLGQAVHDKRDFDNRIKTGFVSVFGVFFVFSVLVILFVKPLLFLMDQKASLIQSSALYIRLESVAILISVLYKFILFVFILRDEKTQLLWLLVLQTVLSVFCDTVFVSQQAFSLGLGVNGIAVTNIIVNTILLGVSVHLLLKDNVMSLQLKGMNFDWQKEWFKVGSFSGLESLIRNVAFLVMILRMVNVISEQGNFWVANSFIWGWLLLPVLALGELIKRNTGEAPDKTRELLPAYLFLTGCMVIFWVISIPAWKPFLVHVMNVNEPDKIYSVILISIGFYVAFAFNNVIDSIFYGLGRTDLMLVQSVVINSIYYGGAYIAYTLGYFQPTLNSIAILFGGGIAMDSIITFGMYLYLEKNGSLYQTQLEVLALGDDSLGYEKGSRLGIRHVR
ncbi:hypothetical protein DSLASN_32010 [Desulfoluna limicola]|uniref:Multidrug transporter n=1 Tax=Desulfoluna limicola TaxID=2810562 RepID=A0ABM7PKD8_9BACT|nr:MATE family Na+-driven efflux transporter [Desulfoluna limicola]BCS97569.1 hypothetical protein DSLASN_32010 [Desulfoluna limicola]